MATVWSFEELFQQKLV